MTRGEKLRNLRKKYKISIVELACEGCSKSLISLLENGEKELNEGIATLLVQSFNKILVEEKVTLEDLIDDENKILFNSLKEFIDTKDFSLENIKRFEKEYDKNSQYLNNYQKIELCYPLGGYLYDSGDFINGKKWYDRIFLLMHFHDNLEWREIVMEDTILILHFMKRPQEIFIYENYIEHFVKDFSVESQHRILIYLMGENDELKRYEKSLFYIDKLSQIIPLPLETQISKGYILYKNRQIDEALELYKYIVNTTKDLHYKSWANYNSIACYLYLNDREKALYRMKATEIALGKNHVHEDYISVFYSGLAEAYIKFNNLKLAKKRFTQSLEFFLSIDVNLSYATNLYETLRLFLGIIETDESEYLNLIIQSFLHLNKTIPNKEFYIRLTDYLLANNLNSEFIHLKNQYENQTTSKESN